MRLLLKHGADVMATTDTGDTPLHIAAMGGSTVIDLADRSVKDHLG
jgi:ankyrin repeat protein